MNLCCMVFLILKGMGLDGLKNVRRRISFELEKDPFFTVTWERKVSRGFKN